MDRIVAVIPVRMASSRFPGKPLALLHGLPMIEHVFRRAKLCSQLDAAYVATCDDEIRYVAEAFGAEVIMTSAAHERATDRVAEAVERLPADIVVMCQSCASTVLEDLKGLDVVFGGNSSVLVDSVTAGVSRRLCR